MALLDKFKRKKEKQEKSIKKEPILNKEEEKKDEKAKPVSKEHSSKAPVEVYKVIKDPHITEKAGILVEQNKYIFNVYPNANKSEVKKAIEALYRVKVEKVHMIRSAPKKRRLGRHQGWRQGLKKGFKKAIVSLKEGDKIELLPR